MNDLIAGIAEKLKNKLKEMWDERAWHAVRELIEGYFPQLGNSNLKIILSIDMKVLDITRGVPVARLPLAGLTTLVGPGGASGRAVGEAANRIDEGVDLSAEERAKLVEDYREGMKTPMYRVTFGLSNAASTQVCEHCNGNGYIYTRSRQ